MRVAALYDVHGNLPALEAVLEDVRRAGVDQVVVGGDVVPGPMPREVMDLLLALEPRALFIRGNGDRAVLDALHGRETTAVPERFREGIRWNAQQLGPGHEQAIGGWPATRTLEVSGLGEVLFCHATPRDDTGIFTRRTAEERLVPVFSGVEASLVVCGHTHMQFDRKVGRTRIVNAGSVGMPFGAPGAFWLYLGPGVQFRRTAYDLAAAAARIRRVTYPQAEDFASRNVLAPPSEEEILKTYAVVELT